jgi:hypothetical protein
MYWAYYITAVPEVPEADLLPVYSYSNQTLIGIIVIVTINQMVSA